jgi:hypothetical protein
VAADSTGDLQVFGVIPTWSVAPLRTLPSTAMTEPCRAVLVVAVVTVPDTLVFPAARCRAGGTWIPAKPARPIVTAFDGAQLTVAVTVERAPPGTEAGESETAFRTGEHATAAPARVAATAWAGCTATASPAVTRDNTAIAQADSRIFTRYRLQ